MIGANDVLRQFVVGFDDDFAGVGVDDVGDRESAFEIFRRDFEPFDLRLLDVVVNATT